MIFWEKVFSNNSNIICHVLLGFLFVVWWVDLNMKNITQNIIGWCAGLAIGITIGLSQNNTILGIGLGVAFGAALGHIQMKEENSSSELD